MPDRDEVLFGVGVCIIVAVLAAAAIEALSWMV